ncbi:hypothetical protein SIID45300_02408 [Candidatus Magnetaquicoccaceae bacterium FCR-1]|uniref:Uncharacterized protein n=1 Tax=Candidatus Magnetaquiglobus chichijimensis TaxID=3141448 RepID=A0ABQ0CAZ0_9PROT
MAHATDEMDRSTLEFFACAEVSARWERGFLSHLFGWAPYLGEFGLLSSRSVTPVGSRHPTGLFATKGDALHAGEVYREACRRRVADCDLNDARDCIGQQGVQQSPLNSSE